MFDLWRKVYRDTALYTLRVIRKKQAVPKECHHLAVLLRAEASEPENYFGNIHGYVVREIKRLPGKNYLELSLLLKKKGNIYYCPQCGEQFDGNDHEFYNRLFEHAKEQRYNVWKLKPLFAKCRKGKKEMNLPNLRKGNQVYCVPVSRMEAGFIKVRMDMDRLYDEAIRRFR